MKIGNNNRIVDFQGKKAEVQDEVKSTNFETKKLKKAQIMFLEIMEKLLLECLLKEIPTLKNP